MKKPMFLLLLFLFAGVACQEKNNPTIPNPSPLFGTWMVIHPAVEAELLVREDSTFHVDILPGTGIEAEGLLTLESENQVTFVNTQGSDSIASNPVPGVYLYLVEQDTLRFTLVNDTLSRRMGLLSYPWVQKN